MNWLGTVGESLGELLFPRRCPLCGAVIYRSERICARCAGDMEFIRPPVCRRCGRPAGKCFCRRDNYAFTRNVSPLCYTRAAKRGIHRMKFRGAPSAAKYFGMLMASTVKAQYIEQGMRFDCVVGVPMHRVDERKRGYNQANLLARTVAQELGLPYASRVLVKYKRSQSQHTLSARERRQNVRDVFRVARPEAVEDRTVLLCDDVITSGSTLSECAATLLEAGAKEIYCVTATAAILSEDGQM